MSWYTTGPGGRRYRFGDVPAVARSSGLGSLFVVPRLAAVDADDVVIESEDSDDLEFLGPLQETIERSGLPWRHLDFALDADPRGERLLVPNDTDVRQTLRELSELVAEHVDSVLTTLAVTAGEPLPVAKLVLSLDTEWIVPAADLPALLDWLNAPFGPESPFSFDGTAPAGALERLAGADPARHLAVHALIWAALAGEDVWLSQPDDDRSAVVWERDLDEHRGGGGAVVLRPADHPFLDELARAFGVATAVREQVFFVRGGPDLDLPPEAEAAPEDVRAGMAFAGYLASIVSTWATARLIPPGGERELAFGWHAGGTLTAITEAFHAAGVRVHPLDRLLAGEREPFAFLSEAARLATFRDSNPDDAVFGYILGGGPAPASVKAGTVACLLVLIEKLDLPPAMLKRLAEVLRAAGHSSEQR